ncbi:MAG: CotH kinase family protein [Muribaculaceae bacterium]|nr:CotH kinase family protein [Muribaculaceae bacterium]
MRRLLFILSILCSLFAAAQYNVSIYRNDSTFNQIKLKEGEWLSHSEGEEGFFADFEDWISGECSVPVSAIDSCVVRASDIPVLRLSFTDYPEAECLWEKELYLEAILDIEGNGFTEDEDALSLQVKGRGNSTWGMPKKPMRLKFPKKISICGFKKAKNYVLLNNYLDPTLMRNVLAMWLAKRLGVPYANTMVPCHVFINGHYAGAYTLTEKVGINSGSVDIEETEGMLFELSVEYDEKYKFRSEEWNLPVMVKDPDFDELYEDEPEGLTPEERLALWQEDFNHAEALVKEGRPEEAFDMESAVNYFMLYEFVKNSEIGYPKSFYIHKKSMGEEDKYYFGPAWDFDVAFNMLVLRDDAAAPASPEGEIWVNALIDEMKESKMFRKLYKEKREIFQEEILPEMLDYLDNYAALIEPSAKLNGLRWPESGFYGSWTAVEPSFDTKRHVDELRDWLIERAEYLRKRDL